MPDPARLEDLTRLAGLIRRLNDFQAELADLLRRPARIGHVGQYVASVVFDIVLHESASRKGHDGYFNRHSPLAGRSVNVKWGAAADGLLDLASDSDVDDYLVFAGPWVGAISSRGKSLPWLIESVYLFDALQLLDALRGRVKIGEATGVRRALWDAAMIYPEPRNPRLVLSDEQRQLLSLFGLS